MMDYFRDHFRKRYAANTRETVRRQTIHQFIQMGLVVANPDNPARSVNSPDTRYRIDPSLLKLARRFGSEAWTKTLSRFLASAEGLQRLRPREREMRKIPVKLSDGTQLKLTEGGQNVLVKPIPEEFCPRFAAGGVLVYAGEGVYDATRSSGLRVFDGSTRADSYRGSSDIDRRPAIPSAGVVA